MWQKTTTGETSFTSFLLPTVLARESTVVLMYAYLLSLFSLISMRLKEKIHINLFIIIFLTIKHDTKLFISLKSLSFFHFIDIVIFVILQISFFFFWHVSMLVLSVFCNQYAIERKSSHQFIHYHILTIKHYKKLFVSLKSLLCWFLYILMHKTFFWKRVIAVMIFTYLNPL